MEISSNIVNGPKSSN